ncbi:MAG: hypothetical protein WBW94_07315 [Anaerolineales bacterium]
MISLLQYPRYVTLSEAKSLRRKAKSLRRKAAGFFTHFVRSE